MTHTPVSISIGGGSLSAGTYPTREQARNAKAFLLMLKAEGMPPDVMARYTENMQIAATRYRTKYNGRPLSTPEPVMFETQTMVRLRAPTATEPRVICGPKDALLPKVQEVWVIQKAEGDYRMQTQRLFTSNIENAYKFTFTEAQSRVKEGDRIINTEDTQP